MRVLGLCGSLRRDSYNRRLLAAASRELPESVAFRIFDDLAKIPPYSEDIDARQTPAVVQTLRTAIATSSAILIATPEYNASMPGLLKNAIDWASRPYPDHVLRSKPVAVVGASTGAFGAILAQADLRRVLKALGAQVLEAELPVSRAHEAFLLDGRLADPQLRSQLAIMVEDLLGVASVDAVEEFA